MNGGRFVKIGLGIVVLFLLDDSADGDQAVVLVAVDEADALGVSADGAGFADLGADDLALGGDHHQLVVVADGEEADDVARVLDSVN